ncbi:MAG: OPT family oligopeptide transporter [Gemmataceae bacterium]
MGTKNNEDPATGFTPFVPDDEQLPELTWTPVIIGSLLGILFGASSLYLVLKVGLTVSASIPVAVMAITLFRGFSAMFGLRRATILENNIVQTTGSAGESIAFGVGLIMPALLLIGFDIDVIRVMTVGVLGSLLGILMMIPLRRAFIVKQHGTLKFPEGTACAEVLMAGEKGGSTAQMVFAGFGLGFVYQFLMLACKLWQDEIAQPLWKTIVGAGGNTTTSGLKGGVLSNEMSPALLGVGYIIGPRIASIMVAGGFLAYLVLVPAIVFFGDGLTSPLAPAVTKINSEDGLDHGIIKNMTTGEIRNNYILYIGAGAVAAGGIISMLRALPVIVSSVRAGLRDLAAERNAARGEHVAKVRRTEHDMSMRVVLFGSIGLVAAMAAAPALGLGFNPVGFAGAAMILIFGFLFVTVSSRLTGEIGSSSNPISGMTVATLLLTCLLFVSLEGLGWLTISKEIKLAALTIAGVVCIASSNGGTTAQALKTGHLVGATPRAQQFAILIGSLTSAVVVGFVLLWLNQAKTTYSKRGLPTTTIDVSKLSNMDHVRTGPYGKDPTEYHVLNVGMGEKNAPVPAGRYLVNDAGQIVYLVDPAVNGKLRYEDEDEGRPEAEKKLREIKKYDAPKTQLMALIINGILDRELPWGLVILGVLIALTLELSGVPALPFAVGVYLPLASSMPIFIGGCIRWVVDKFNPMTEAEADSSPAVLLSSGYIAGGSIAALIVAFLNFKKEWLDWFDLSDRFKDIKIGSETWGSSLIPGVSAFAVLIVVLTIVGLRRKPLAE